jgi:hypothetical protein
VNPSGISSEKPGASADGPLAFDPKDRSSLESALAGALKERLAVIADRAWYARDADGHLQALIQVSERILAAAAELPKPLHPQLAHYLERCSYDKALAFLEGNAPAEANHAH